MRRIDLKIFRIRHGLTQDDMAERIGCARDAYCAIEAGKRDPSVSFFVKLQKAFDIPNAEMWELVLRENEAASA